MFSLSTVPLNNVVNPTQASPPDDFYVPYVICWVLFATTRADERTNFIN